MLTSIFYIVLPIVLPIELPIVGGVHFKKVHFSIISDITSQSHIEKMTVFLQSF